MRTVFVTHNELGLACLEELVDLGADIRGVFTRPQQEGIADQTTLSEFAERHDVPFHETDSVTSASTVERIAACDPELLFVIGWSQLVSERIINSASVASLGMHPAPLPRGRGRAPIAWSLIKGLERTQLSFFHLVEEADAGPLVGQQPIDIEPEDDATSVYEKVVEAGRHLIREYYPSFERGIVPEIEQNDDEATWWPKREPHHGVIDWTRTPNEVYNWIRGQTHPYPGAFTYLDGRKVTIWGAKPPENETVFVKPGEIRYRDGDEIGVGAWEGVIELTCVQVAGGDERPAAALLDEGIAEIGESFDTAWDGLRE